MAHPYTRIALQVLSRLAAPTVLLIAGFVLVYVGDTLPVPLSKSSTYVSYVVLAAGAAVALVFRSGRALFALVTLLLAFGAQQYWLQQGLTTPAAQAVYLALAVFVPLNLALLATLREQGTINRSGALRLAAIVLEIGIAGLLVAIGAAWTAGKFLPFGIGALPHAGVVVILASVIAALRAAYVSRSAVSASCAMAIVAFVVAAHVPTASYTYSIFTIAAGLMLTFAVLHDAFRVAFRDELTGLPGRRALDERFDALPRKYAIAMVEIDHFKEFCDTWGPELGDHARKMVAARIRNAVGRNNAYRHGGEEFAAILPRSSAAEAMPRLEALREDVESYLIAVRAPHRLQTTKRARRPGGWKGSDTTVSVTVSIGVADNGSDLDTPGAVLQAADRALARAREKTKNTVSL